VAARLTAFLVAGIVGITFVAGLIVGAQRDDDSGPVDLIVYNGRVFTGEARGALAEALAVRGNRIIHVGSNREIKRLRRRQTTVIDAHGGAVLPGFNDAHAHVISGGLAMDRAALSDATTPAAMQAKARAFAEQDPEREWVPGERWDHWLFPGARPTKHLLDAALPDRPVDLTAYQGHSGWADTRALELAGRSGETPSPLQGPMVRGRQTGEPTGMLGDAAMAPVSPALPLAAKEDRLRALRAAVLEAHRVGVTSVQDAGVSADDLALLAEARERGDLTVRVYATLSAGPGLTDAELEALEEIRARYPDDPVLKAGAVKLMADGVVETHTATTLEEHASEEASGPPRFTTEELRRVVTLLDQRGWQVIVHAIGDAALRMALDAFEQATASNPAPARGRRHRIEHVDIVDPDDIPRFASAGVIASMQPFRAGRDPGLRDVWSENLGPGRAARGWALASLQRGGARVVFGSDWPAVALDPRLGIHAAIMHATPEGEMAADPQPEERIGLPEALEAYTAQGAYASFDELRKGRLAPDMLADIVILSADIFTVPPDELLDVEVTTTIFDGKVVYERAAASTD
jgi:predicted amidohydrolase YtcJ